MAFFKNLYMYMLIPVYMLSLFYSKLLSVKSDPSQLPRQVSFTFAFSSMELPAFGGSAHTDRVSVMLNGEEGAALNDGTPVGASLAILCP